MHLIHFSGTVGFAKHYRRGLFNDEVQ